MKSINGGKRGCPFNTDVNPASMISKMPTTGPSGAVLDSRAGHNKLPQTWLLKEQNFFFPPTVMEAENLKSVSLSQNQDVSWALLTPEALEENLLDASSSSG